MYYLPAKMISPINKTASKFDMTMPRNIIEANTIFSSTIFSEFFEITTHLDRFTKF